MPTGRLIGMYRWVEHTSELELEISATTEDGVLSESIRAMVELMAGEDAVEPPASEAGELRVIRVEAPDRPRLLAELLGEIAFLAETERFVPVDLERLGVTEGRVEATIRGRVGDPPHLVKAVTYHRLAFEPDGAGYRATAVLDV